MEKVVLIDGNSFIFRAFYATYYTNNLMVTTKGIPTNALYGYINFIEAIIKDSNPEYLVVALDKGSNTFRKKLFTDYKAQRDKAPSDLINQFKMIREYMDKRKIKWIESDDYEADDIIGSLANQFGKKHEVVIYTGDQDYLQLVKENVKVSLVKKGGLSQSIVYDEQLVEFDYGVSPQMFIDLKALIGDKSDNIPGVNGIGEKTAIKYLLKYKTLENLYDQIKLEKKSKTQEKFIIDQENAFLSQKLAKIVTDHDFAVELNTLKTNLSLDNDYKEFLQKFELKSMIKRFFENFEEKKEEITIKETLLVRNQTPLKEIKFAYFITSKEESYHFQSVNYLICGNEQETYIYDNENINLTLLTKIFNEKVCVFDAKKTNFLLQKYEMEYIEFKNDIMLMSYVIDAENDVTQLSKLAYEFNIELALQKEVLKNLENIEYINEYAQKISQVFFISFNEYEQKIKGEKLQELYDLELGVAKVLFKMENQGITFNYQTNKEMCDLVQLRLQDLEQKIYALAQKEFNINSPKQLGEILFEDLQIPYPKKKTQKSYSTAVEILEKIVFAHPIIVEILEYRKLNKLATTYLQAFDKFVIEHKIHTIYNQCKTATGRLSSNYPNLQNIPIRSELGKQVRKSFEAQTGFSLVAIDYSQIELRVIAAIANEQKMLKAFKTGYDIHSDTAAKILNIGYEEVTPQQRKMAKAINFGIIYGMGPFKLAQDLNISQVQAKEFIQKYLDTYSNIASYIEQTKVQAHQNLYVETYFKRKRYIKGINDSNKTIVALNERIAINSPIQGTAADIIKIAMVKINEKIGNSNNVNLLLQIHDELVFEIKDECLEELKTQIIAIMQNVVDLGVNFECNYKIGKNWYNMK